MTVGELISGWTEEEQRQHADLIAECLEREKTLRNLKERMRTSEEQLQKELDQLLSGLKILSKAIQKNGDLLQTIYLCLARAKGNA